MSENRTTEGASEEWEALHRSESTLFQRRENVQKHTSYAAERQVLDMIRSGQTDQVEALLAAEPDGTPGILSKNELRNCKNMFIAGVTLFTRAAIEGGVPEETAYAISDGYIQTMEECRDMDAIEALRKKAVSRFTKEVEKHSRRRFSRTVEGTIRYVHLHLHETITLRQAAEAVGISESYLSRLFQKETGISFVDYIQKERVEAACSMLAHSEYSLSEIGEYLGFANQSYFIRIFRKFKGTTPARYRKYNCGSIGTATESP